MLQGSFHSTIISKSLILPLLLTLVSCGGGDSDKGLPETDQTVPTVIVLPTTPSVGQTVPVTAMIKAIFNKSMNATSVEQGFIVIPNNNGTIQYDAGSKTAIYVPDPNQGINLQGDTDYIVTLKNTIKDIGNNPLAETTWSFKTEDNINPVLTQCIPKCDGSPTVNVGLGLSIYLIFNEAMFIDSFTNSTVVVKAQGSNTALIGNFQIADAVNEPNKVIWNALASNKIQPLTTYIVTVTTGVQDNSLNHNQLLTEKIFTFTTGNFVDVLRPQVQSITPNDGANNIALNAVIAVQFINEDGTPEIMDWTSINASNFLVENESKEHVSGIFSNNQTDTLTFTPNVSANSSTAKNLNLLDTYTVTLKNTIKDKAGNALITTSINNQLISKFYTGDGVLKSTPSNLGVALDSVATSTIIESNVHLTIKTDGTVQAYWVNYDATSKDRRLMTNEYSLINGWNSNSLDITSSVVTQNVVKPTTLSSPHSLQQIVDVVMDSNGNPLVFWLDKMTDYNQTPLEFPSLLASKSLNGNWQEAIFIHKGSVTKNLNANWGIASPLAAHRSQNGTVTILWTEVDVTGTPVFDANVLQMRQLKSNNGVFGTTWGATKRVSDYTTTTNPIWENKPLLNSDDAGNIFVFYEESTSISNFTSDNINKTLVAKYPFPVIDAANSFQIGNGSYQTVSDNVNGNIIFGWSNNSNNIMAAIYDTKNTLKPDAAHVVDNANYIGLGTNGFGVAMFSTGEALVVSTNSNEINYTQYDPLNAGWQTTQVLAPVITDKFYFFRGERNIVTVAWAVNPTAGSSVSTVYIKRYKPGVNFGWQQTQSFSATQFKHINIISGKDGRATIVWKTGNTAIADLPYNSSEVIFATRIE